MSKITIALEAAVAAVVENRSAEGERQTARQRANTDRAFATILKLIAPRIRHFIRQYGLTAHWDDAEQCCAIGVHRAIEAYDPTKAQFTTFVNWQIRGELQSLRFRLMTDQRASAKKVEATTVSLHTASSGAEGGESSLETIIEDEFALNRTEAGASEYLAKRATKALIDEYVRHHRAAGLEKLCKRPQPKRAMRKLAQAQPGVPQIHSGLDPVELEKLTEQLDRDREILERRVFDDATLDDVGMETGIAKERIRQISKRASKSIAELAASQPRFMIMSEYGNVAAAKPRKSASAPAEALMVAETSTSLLPDPAQSHNHALRVVAVEATHPAQASGRPALENTTRDAESVFDRSVATMGEALAA
jgi:RNA polymerase sigma-32 factor